MHFLSLFTNITGIHFFKSGDTKKPRALQHQCLTCLCPVPYKKSSRNDPFSYVIAALGNAIRQILKQKPDACFCASEEFAARIGHAFKKAGLRIPEDISLMGLEPLYLNEFFTPPITAILQDFEQIAAVAAEMMYQAIFNKIPPTCATIPFQLIERESVRNPEKG